MLMIVGGLVLAVGTVIALYGTIMLLIEAFRTHILWLLGSIFVPFVSLIFAIMHWDRAGRPFLISLAGGAIAGLGGGIMLMGMPRDRMVEQGAAFLLSLG